MVRLAFSLNAASCSSLRYYDRSGIRLVPESRSTAPVPVHPILSFQIGRFVFSRRVCWMERLQNSKLAHPCMFNIVGAAIFAPRDMVWDVTVRYLPILRFDWTIQLYRLVYHPLKNLARRTQNACVSLESVEVVRAFTRKNDRFLGTISTCLSTFDDVP